MTAFLVGSDFWYWYLQGVSVEGKEARKRSKISAGYVVIGVICGIPNGLIIDAVYIYVLQWMDLKEK